MSSSSTPTAIPTLPSSATPSAASYLSNIGLGYSIAIALGFLVLLSTILLASYICCRSSRHRPPQNDVVLDSPPPEGIILPRIIFVAEDDEDRENGAVGLDQAVINSYPRFQFSKNGDLGGNGNTTCSICLCDFKDLEMLRMMPECRHFFHLCCLDAWLKLNGSCPVCRNSPLPTPLSTPLSEVVPLSQYPADRRRRR
ncbi:RING/U-box superfamily protein [Euphorbia peplus]|nr:RING/U-box superfamily protein [Euphorbia peplus]